MLKKYHKNLSKKAEKDKIQNLVQKKNQDKNPNKLKKAIKE